MTVKGKIFMCTTFLFLGIGIGLVGGYTFAKKQANTGNQINVSVDGKVKKDGNVNINLEGNDQDQAKKRRK
ncbi:hypothetical protein [Saccharicrinis fermentans]|uniref:Uncharacterized protein n=1 Tax=Saccharicrinis fermentans DSM 9555 = JCM 21142 TaxID=869213 RepID=W7YDQ0_9BACT|nr:hypothetical protein [Saccharicrinis fermentans]GAF05603.1 hypothetical protein JCM21142_104344 [Saccharicrinis fermentans DSM 9555 = JCM 21142]